MRHNCNKTFSGIREIADGLNQHELSQFKLTSYLILNKFSLIGMINLKSQFEGNGLTVNLGEK